VARRRLSIQARSSVLITGGGGCVSSINRSYLTGAKQASASRTCIIAPCPARGAGLNVERGAGCRCAAQSSRRRWWTPDAGRRAGTPDAGHPRHRSLVALVRHRRRSGPCTADSDAHRCGVAERGGIIEERRGSGIISSETKVAVSAKKATEFRVLP